MNYAPALFRERPRSQQIVAAVVLPALIGAVAGVLIGVSTGAYWVISVLAAIGGLHAGYEHVGGLDGARRGAVGGAVYGAALLIAHAIAGTDAKVDLGSFPPFLIVITAVIGAILGVIGGALRARREGAQPGPAR